MSTTQKSARKRSREVALQVLYAIDVAKSGTPPREAPDPQAVFDYVAGSFEMPEGAKSFANELVSETTRCGADLDEQIGSHSRNWRVERMATVDRNVLRLASYELGHTETPTAVILDEAVELARRFGGDASPSFVNGILDAIARTLRSEERRSG